MIASDALETTYKVEKNDTLIGIALRNNMKVSDLKYMNHLFGSDVYEGQILQIKSKRRQRSKSLPHSQLALLTMNNNSSSKLREIDEKTDGSNSPTVSSPAPSPCTSPKVQQPSEKSTIRRELTRSATEFNLPFTQTLPKLLGGSCAEVLVDPSFSFLVPKLESCLARHNRGYDWKLLYSLQQHGASLGTLYSKVQKKSPTILVVETNKGDVFGGFASVPWHPDGHYYGNGECFLFKATPEFQVFRWTMANSMLMFSNDDSIAMGGGGGFGLFLNSDLSQGSSAVCNTFQNECLASDEDFSVVSVEVWGFVTKR